MHLGPLVSAVCAPVRVLKVLDIHYDSGALLKWRDERRRCAVNQPGFHLGLRRGQLFPDGLSSNPFLAHEPYVESPPAGRAVAKERPDFG